MTSRQTSVLVMLLLCVGRSATPALSAIPEAVDDAFYLLAYYDEEKFVFLSWVIAPGHFILRDKIAVTLNGKRLTLATPPGRAANGAEIYGAPSVTAIVLDDMPTEGQMLVTYQGCADEYVWCPTVTKVVDVKTLGVTSSPLE